ncbi:hypothetical protein [Vibrio diabolicus]|uniref:hypothetical protein n=1 Tax=Vibrio diabolicus TaxID=50719 RepID=UPI002151B98B|nr:hypothetical protein [Vibrio diabolicus]UDY85043.1 hypothetical protein LJY22_15385 [Vibrio diabolicus]
MKSKLGNWKVVKKGDDVLEVQLPEGMVLTGKEISIEDLVEAVKRFEVIKDGEETRSSGTVTIRCCRGNTAIA